MVIRLGLLLLRLLPVAPVLAVLASRQRGSIYLQWESVRGASRLNCAYVAPRIYVGAVGGCRWRRGVNLRKGQVTHDIRTDFVEALSLLQNSSAR